MNPSFAANNQNPFKLAFTYPVNLSHYQPEERALSHFLAITGQLFLPLIAQRSDGEIIPSAAKTWSWSKSGKILKFTLREDLFWSNGTPLTADDFVFSLKKSALHNEVFRDLDDRIIGWNEWQKGNQDAPFGVTALGKHDLQFEFNTKKPVSLFHFANVFAAKINGSEALSKKAQFWGELKSPPSYGPYMVHRFLDNELILRKNPHFPETDLIEVKTIRIYGNKSTNWLSEYVSQQLDGLLGPLGKQDQWIRNHYKDGLYNISTPKLYFLLPDKRKEKLNNSRLMDALYLALDRKSFVEGQFGIYQPHNEGIIPMNFAGYTGLDRSEDLENFELRYHKANALMRGLGYNEENRLKLKLAVAETVPGYNEIAEFLKGSWSSIFIDLELVRIRTYGGMFERFTNEEFDLTISSFSAGYFDQTVYLRLPKYFYELVKFPISKDYLYALDEIDQESVKAKRDVLIKRLDYKVLQHKWIMPILAKNESALVGNRFTGIKKALNIGFPSLNIRYLKVKKSQRVLSLNND